MIGQMFMGGYLYGRLKEQLQRGEERSGKPPAVAALHLTGDRP